MSRLGSSPTPASGHPRSWVEALKHCSGCPRRRRRTSVAPGLGGCMEAGSWWRQWRWRRSLETATEEERRRQRARHCVSLGRVRAVGGREMGRQTDDAASCPRRTSSTEEDAHHGPAARSLPVARPPNRRGPAPLLLLPTTMAWRWSHWRHYGVARCGHGQKRFQNPL
jgi:hypothetical protein